MCYAGSEAAGGNGTSTDRKGRGLMTADHLTEQLEAELTRLRATEVGQRIAAIELLLGQSPDGPAGMLRADLETRIRSTRRGRGVSDAKLRAVRSYMEAHAGQDVRQVDISRDLNENSGSISLALRALEGAGDVEDTGRVDRKSKVWRFTGEVQRATNITPGEGVEPGRRR